MTLSSHPDFDAARATAIELADELGHVIYISPRCPARGSYYVGTRADFIDNGTHQETSVYPGQATSAAPTFGIAP